jgi:hypothetical protein
MGIGTLRFLSSTQHGPDDCGFGERKLLPSGIEMDEFGQGILSVKAITRT